ncbi:MAG: DUF1902 domain-containing protein [Methylocella sp.]
MIYNVKIHYDDEKRIYFVSSSDIPGLHVESETFDQLIEIVRDLASDLLPGDRALEAIEFRFLVPA